MSTSYIKAYYHIFYYHFLSIFAYPYELLITVAQPAIKIGFLALFWSMIAKGSNQPINLTEIIAYFLMVEFIQIWALDPDGLNLANFFGWRIKMGWISKNIIQPVPTLPSLFFEQRGYYGVDMIFSTLLFALSIYLMGGTSWFQLVWFLTFLLLSFVITLSFCILVGSIAFITKEINSIRHSVSHIIWILSGALVPLSFFPEKTKAWLVLTPFPSMVFSPINVLQHKMSSGEVLQDLIVSVVWAVTLFSLALFVWKVNMRKYEAVGI